MRLWRGQRSLPKFTTGSMCNKKFRAPKMVPCVLGLQDLHELDGPTHINRASSHSAWAFFIRRPRSSSTTGGVSGGCSATGQQSQRVAHSDTASGHWSRGLPQAVSMSVTLHFWLNYGTRTSHKWHKVHNQCITGVYLKTSPFL